MLTTATFRKLTGGEGEGVATGGAHLGYTTRNHGSALGEKQLSEVAATVSTLSKAPLLGDSATGGEGCHAH